MANTFQRMIYNISNTVPLLLMTGLVWYIQNKSWFIPVILLAVALFITIIFSVCFVYGKNNCPIKRINVSSISSKDSWILAYILAYLLPFANLVISDYNIILLVFIGLVLALVIIPAILALPNVLLFARGYHFYEIGTGETGVSDYLLISKRKRIRNKTEIKTVMRVFERLLIDTKGND